MRKKFFQTGQVLVLYALVLPIMFIFIGMAADFGWLYFNQSRLQNAADAAVTAGANALLGDIYHHDESAFSDYTYTTFVSNNEEGLIKLMRDNIKSTTRDTSGGDAVAKKYVIANMSDNSNLTDKLNDNAEVKFNTVLYGYDDEDYKALYYTVTLEEDLKHLFGIMEKFIDTEYKAKVMAAAKISHVIVRAPNTGNKSYPHGPSLFDQMKAKEIKETYMDWDVIAVAKNSSNLADERSVLTGGAYYASGNHYRTELSVLNGHAFSNEKGNTQQKSVDQTEFDDLFIDFQGEMANDSMSNEEDVDLNGSYNSGNWDYGDNNNKEQYNYRVHFPINIDAVYPVRTDKGKDAPDCLYARIESEPVKNTDGHYIINQNGDFEWLNWNRGNGSAVRQIIINVNVDNTAENARPIVLFYEGPEHGKALYKGDDNKTREKARAANPHSWEDVCEKSKREHLPIILNLNANFKGIIFVPNNPVAINGNGHNFEGFIVAKSFKQLTTTGTDKITEEKIVYNHTQKIDKLGENDFETVKKKDGKTTITTHFQTPIFIDSKGNVQFDNIKPEHALPEKTNPKNPEEKYSYKPNDPDWKYEDDLKFSDSELKDKFKLGTVKYNSFLNVGLVNYTYLSDAENGKTPKWATAPNDVFYTTERSKHID